MYDFYNFLIKDHLKVNDFPHRAHKIRNRISKYSLNSILKLVFYSIDDNVNRGEYWILPKLLMAEWAIEVCKKNETNQIKENEVNQILNKIWALQEQALDLKSSKNISFSMRRFMINQFIIQSDLSLYTNDLVRMKHILLNGKYGNYFNEWFNDETGICLFDFFDILMTIELISHNGNIKVFKYKDVISTLHPGFSMESIIKTIRLLGSTIEEIREECLEKRDKSKGLSSKDYFAESIFVSNPLILLKEGIIIPSSNTTSLGLSIFILRFFKKKAGKLFNDRFGSLFEDYLEDLISQTNVKFKNESDIKKIYKKELPKNKSNDSLVDFVVYNKEHSLFIDAKGVEPKNDVLTTNNPKVIKERLRDHILKGIKQASVVSGNLTSIDLLNNNKKEKRFAMIVTHQDFFISNANALKTYLGEKYNHKVSEAINNQFDYKNVYVFSISGFEAIVSICKKTNTSIFDFLEFCSSSEQETISNALSSYQYIYNYSEEKNVNEISYSNEKILQKFYEYHDEILIKIDKSKSHWIKGGDGKINHFLQCMSEISSLSSKTQYR